MLIWNTLLGYFSPRPGGSGDDTFAIVVHLLPCPITMGKGLGLGVLPSDPQKCRLVNPEGEGLGLGCKCIQTFCPNEH